MRRRWSLVVLVAVALGAWGLWIGLERGWWRLAHPDPARFPLWGVDVSHHQGAVDWAAVARTPRVAFAYVKASEGGDWRDPRFDENWRGARRAGLRAGAYHFYTFCRDPETQARNFLAAAPPAADALPPAVDLEFGGNCRAVPSRAALLRDLRAWLARVEAAWGRRVVVYVTRDAYDVYVRGSGLARPLWVRDLVREPRLPDAPWSLWQFHHRARIDGVAGPVDLNAFRGDRAALGRL